MHSIFERAMYNTQLLPRQLRTYLQQLTHQHYQTSSQLKKNTTKWTLNLLLLQALQQYKPPEPSAKPLTWDQHLIASIAAATKLSGGTAAATWAALEAFVAAKLSGGLQKSPPRCSDLVWAGLGMATAFVVLGVLAAAAKTLPVVGNWHQHVSMARSLGVFFD